MTKYFKMNKLSFKIQIRGLNVFFSFGFQKITKFSSECFRI